MTGYCRTVLPVEESMVPVVAYPRLHSVEDYKWIVVVVVVAAVDVGPADIQQSCPRVGTRSGTVGTQVQWRPVAS